MATQQINKQFTIPEDYIGSRLDQTLAELLPDYSRSRLQDWIQQGFVTVNGEQWRTRDLVRGGELVIICAELAEVTTWQAEDIQLDITFEDEDLIIVNKPRGLVVHPAAGHQRGTLVNALLHYAPELDKLPRAGIVHRLDKDTSGLLMVARQPSSHAYLVEQLQQRLITREYAAIVQGEIIAGGSIDKPIGRHPRHRIKMAVRDVGGKSAVTHYRVLERFPAHTYLKVNLETGRTHQIRVHMAHILHPIVGDPLYGGRLKLPRNINETLRQTLKNAKQQALHAKKLGLHHPRTREYMEWQQKIPDDMQQLLTLLRQETTKK